MHPTATPAPGLVRRAVRLVLAALVAVASIALATPSVRADAPADVPVGVVKALPPLTGVAQLESGYVHRCVLKIDDSVWCWGAGFYGSLGQGDRVSSLVPSRVALPGDAVDLAAGWFHTCAVLEDATVWCWGRNTSRELGFDGPEALVPTQVPGVTNAARIWAGPSSTCVAGTNDKLRCWGYNLNSGLVPASSSGILPTTMAGIAGVQDVAMTGTSTCVILADDSVRCWGKDAKGALGDGAGLEKTVGSADAVEPVGVTNVIDLAATAGATCALRTGQFATSVWCWGSNEFGDAGPSGTGLHQEPVKIANLLDARSIDGTLVQMCVRTASSAAVCWGSDVDHTGDVTDEFGPTEVYPDSVAAVEVGGRGLCVLAPNKTVRCRGYNLAGESGGAAGQAISPGTNVIDPDPVYTATDPLVVMATRSGVATIDGLHQGGGRIAASTKVRVGIAGRPGVPTGGSTVMLQVRVSGATKAGTLVVFPCSSTAPRATTVAFGRSAAFSTTTVARLSQGDVCLRSSRRVHVVLELVGRQAVDGGLTARRPARLWDTRRTTVDGQMADTGLTPKGSPTIVQVLGRAGLPATGVSGVLLSVTAGQGKAGGSFVVEACGAADSRATSGAYRRRGLASTLVVATTDVDGRVCLTTTSRTHLTLDVVGVVTSDGAFAAGDIARLADTRPGGLADTAVNNANGKIPAGGSLDIALVRLDSWIPATATPSAVVFVTVTVHSPAADGVVAVMGCGKPDTARDTVLVRTGVTTSAIAVVAPGDYNAICLTSTVATHLTVDISGRFHW